MKQKTTNEPEQISVTAGRGLRIYVASLADYNAGRLHGRWIEVSSGAADIHSEIADMLAESSEDIAEDWAIHDYEGFEPLKISEWHEVENLAAIANGVEQHGELFLHVLDYLGDTKHIDEATQCLNEQYQGSADTLAAWAEDFMHETSSDAIKALPSVLQFCIDWDQVAREFERSGDVFGIRVDDSVHVFWSR